jgi:uncharacterized protein (TIGR02246 family)
MKLMALALLFTAAWGATPDADIRAVLTAQVAAWNRGDLAGFMQTYSPDAVFVGREIARGNQSVLEHYRRTYPTREKMGTLTFSGIEVRMLGDSYASVIGRFQLSRSAADGGGAHGIFTLLLSNAGGEWRIVLDHTSS